MISPLVIIGTHAFTPQIHFTHGVASGDVASKLQTFGPRLDQDTHVSVREYLLKHPNFKKLQFSKIRSKPLQILTLPSNLWQGD